MVGDNATGIQRQFAPTWSSRPNLYKPLGDVSFDGALTLKDMQSTLTRHSKGKNLLWVAGQVSWAKFDDMTRNFDDATDLGGGKYSRVWWSAKQK
jgi:hypothetical protein